MAGSPARHVRSGRRWPAFSHLTINAAFHSGTTRHCRPPSRRDAGWSGTVASPGSPTPIRAYNPACNGRSSRRLGPRWTRPAARPGERCPRRSAITWDRWLHPGVAACPLSSGGGGSRPRLSTRRPGYVHTTRLATVAKYVRTPSSSALPRAAS